MSLVRRCNDVIADLDRRLREQGVVV